MECLNCQATTKNPRFCSKSCAAKYNNVKFPKRKVEGSCKTCKKPIKSSNVYCLPCRKEFLANPDITLGEMIYTKHVRSAAFALVRDRAKNLVKNLPDFQACCNCGYNKHVEICHIIPIAKFDNSTMVSVINRLSNLVALCPNCHWEFDYSDLKTSCSGRLRSCIDPS